VKILVLCYEYPPVGGGGGRVAAQIAAELVRKGHRVRVLTAGLKHLRKREIIDGVEILRIESYRRREDTCSVAEMGLYLATSWFPALRIAREFQPDVIHAHFAVPTGVLAWWLGWMLRCPYVLTAHLGDVPGGVPEQTSHLFALVDPGARRIWRSAKCVTAVSGYVTALAEKAYGIKARTIPNGVPPLGKAELRVNPRPKVLFVGRLSVQKNSLLAVQALALVREFDWDFEVIGEGPLGDAMREEARRLGIENRTTFSGWLDGTEVARRMDDSDVLLMTSLHEGLPMVAVEALQHGLAIVGSEIGGMRDVVDETNGFLCALNPEAFAQKLREILSNPALLENLRRASLIKAHTFDLSQIVGAYEQVLLEASSAKP